MSFSVWPSGLSFNKHNKDYTQNKAAKNVCVEEKVLIRLTFDPGLALTSFRATLPRFQQEMSPHLVSGQHNKTRDLDEL